MVISVLAEALVAIELDDEDIELDDDDDIELDDEDIELDVVIGPMEDDCSGGLTKVTVVSGTLSLRNFPTSQIDCAVHDVGSHESPPKTQRSATA